MDLYVRKGEPIRAELWNALIDALGLAGTEIFSGKGIRRRVFGGKTILSASGTGTSRPPLRFFQISDASTRGETGAIDESRVNLVPSLLVQDVPSAGLTHLVVEDGYKIFAHVEFDPETGEVTARTIEAAADVPYASQGHAYLHIGSVAINEANTTLTPTNYIYGPITGCRDWFQEPLSYTLEGSP